MNFQSSKFRRLLGTLALAAIVAGAPETAQAYELVAIDSFNSPVDVRQAPGFDNRLFVVEKPGRIMVVRDGVKLATPFLDIVGLVADGGEQGLLSLAFPPDYE